MNAISPILLVEDLDSDSELIGFVRKTADREISAKSLSHFASFWFETATLPFPA